MRKFAMACALGAYALQPVAAVAGTKDFAVQGYALPANKPVTIVMMRPDVTVGELQAGGLPQPSAEWTETARGQISKALKAELGERQLNFVAMEEQTPAWRVKLNEEAKAKCLAEAAAVQVVPAVQPLPGGATAVPVVAPAADCSKAEAVAPFDAEARIAEYDSLHEAVAQAILAHQYGLGAGKLPTKKGNFEYTLGTGTAQLAQVSGANYGLIVVTIDEFASASRKAMQVMGALGCIIGACVIVGGGIHVGYVSLLELETGNIVWFNLLRGSQGDVREEAGARGMVKAIMAGMPTRPGEMMVQAKTRK